MNIFYIIFHKYFFYKMIEVLEEEFELDIKYENYEYIDVTYNGILIYLNNENNTIYAYNTDEERCQFKYILSSSYKEHQFKLSNNGVYFVDFNNKTHLVKLINIDKREIIDEFILELNYKNIAISFDYKSNLILFCHNIFSKYFGINIISRYMERNEIHPKINKFYDELNNLNNELTRFSIFNSITPIFLTSKEEYNNFIEPFDEELKERINRRFLINFNKIFEEINNFELKYFKDIRKSYCYNISDKKLKEYNFIIKYQKMLFNEDNQYFFNANINFMIPSGKNNIINFYYYDHRSIIAKNIDYLNYVIIKFTSMKIADKFNHYISFSINSFKNIDKNMLIDNYIDLSSYYNEFFIKNDNIHYYKNYNLYEIKSDKIKNNYHVINVYENVLSISFNKITANQKIFISDRKIYKYHQYFNNKLDNKKLIELWNNYQDFKLLDKYDKPIKVNSFLLRKYSKTIDTLIEDYEDENLIPLINIEDINEVNKMFINLFNGKYSHPYLRRYLGIENNISNKEKEIFSLYKEGNDKEKQIITHNNILIYYNRDIITEFDLDNNLIDYNKDIITGFDLDNNLIKFKLDISRVYIDTSNFLFSVSPNAKYLVYRDGYYIYLYNVNSNEMIRKFELKEIKGERNIFSSKDIPDNIYFDLKCRYMLFWYDELHINLIIYDIKKNKLITYNIDNKNYDRYLNYNHIYDYNLYFFGNDFIFELSNYKLLKKYENNVYQYKLKYVNNDDYNLICFTIEKYILFSGSKLKQIFKKQLDKSFRLDLSNNNDFLVKNNIIYFYMKDSHDGNLIKIYYDKENNLVKSKLDFDQNYFNERYSSIKISTDGRYLTLDKRIFQMEKYQNNIFNSETLIEFWNEKQYQDVTIKNKYGEIRRNRVLLSAYSQLINNNPNSDLFKIDDIFRIEDINQMFLDIFNNINDTFPELRLIFSIIS